MDTASETTAFHYTVQHRFTDARGRKIPDGKFTISIHEGNDDDHLATDELINLEQEHLSACNRFPYSNVRLVLTTWRELIVFDSDDELGRADVLTAVVEA